MSQQALEQRVGELETGQARQEVRLGRIESDVGKIGAGVDKLLERDAKRPQAMSWGTIAGAAGGLIAVGAVVWFVVETSPAVRNLSSEVAKARSDLKDDIRKVERQVERLDDPQIGRVPAVERRVEDVERQVRQLEAWQPKVTRYSP